MESRFLLPMLNTLQTVERGIRNVSAKEIGTGTGTVVAIGTANEPGIGTKIVIVLEDQMITTTKNHEGGSMNEKTTTKIEAMISTANPDDMKMNIVLGIVTGTGTQNVIGIRNPDQIGKEKKIGIGIETETERRKEERRNGNGNEEIGNGATENEATENEVTETEETKTEETKTEETKTEETKTEGTKTEGTKTEETGKRTEGNLVNHELHRLVNPRLLRRQLRVTPLDPSSRKCLLPTIIATVLYLHLRRQTLDHQVSTYLLSLVSHRNLDFVISISCSTHVFFRNNSVTVVFLFILIC